MDHYTITKLQLARNVARIAGKDRFAAIGLLADLTGMRLSDARRLVVDAIAAHPVPVWVHSLTGELDTDVGERARVALEVAAARTAFVIERLDAVDACHQTVGAAS